MLAFKRHCVSAGDDVRGLKDVQERSWQLGTKRPRSQLDWVHSLYQLLGECHQPRQQPPKRPHPECRITLAGHRARDAPVLVIRPGFGHALVATGSDDWRLHRVQIVERLGIRNMQDPAVLEDTFEPELVSTSLLRPAFCTSSPDLFGSDVGEASNSNSNIPPRCTRELV